MSWPPSGAADAIVKSPPSRFIAGVQLQFLFRPVRATQPADDWLAVGEQRVPLRLVRNHRARRYILRLLPDGSARVTLPRGGSEAEAHRFAARHIDWLARQIQRRASRPASPRTWGPGSEIYFRGEKARLEASVNGVTQQARFADQVVRMDSAEADWRPAIERHLWRLAACELPARVLELATAHASPVRRVTVRNQRSRWGSCSLRGTISLNWRLVQTPPWVRDYLILHELMHLREMNHSRRFWREVEQVCPNYAEAERWLKQHSELLR